MDHIVHRVLRFDHFALDLARGCLRAGDQEIDLRPKTYEVLCYLTENAGRLVSKQELFEAAWPNVSVCDDSLVQCIRELRQKLGDENRRLIKTVSRRGYLLDVSVSAQGPRSSLDGSAATPAERARKPPAGLAVLRCALRAIPAQQLRGWGAAAAAGFMCVALAITYMVGPPVLIAGPGSASLAENVAVGPPPRPTFRDCADCPEMVALAAGEFVMGSSEDERRHQATEGLLRRVIIPKRIAIGKFEVTIDQFSTFVAETGTEAGTQCRAIVGDSGSREYFFVFGPPEASFRSPSFAVTGAYPAVCVSWNDAQEYTAWLKARTGKPYRLPTEAEWEYAARAGTRTWYSFGDDPIALCAHGRFANFKSPYPWHDGCSNDTASPIAVGQRAPNPWGIFDMHGNAWEWVEDCWMPDASKIPTDGSAFSPPGGCPAHGVRGGSWVNNAREAGSAVRRSFRAESRTTHVGFRVALSLGD